MTKWMRLVALMAATVWTGAPIPCQTSSPWDQPAAALAGEVAEVLGPGQARLVIRNQSTISIDEVPAIRRLIEQDLKAHGVQVSGGESASVIRVTLSENVRERLWVAEVIEGSEAHVTMVHVERGTQPAAQTGGGMMLRKEAVLATKEPVVALLVQSNALVALEPEEIVLYGKTPNGWQEQKRVPIGQKRALARDPHGVILPTQDGSGFEAVVAAVECNGAFPAAEGFGASSVRCHESDDPWPIAVNGNAGGAAVAPISLKGFYNAARDYFTGVVAPGVGVDLPAFYSAVLLPRPSGGGLLIGGIDGKVQLVENGALRAVSGTRDWGGDFAALHSGCGSSAQVIASSSGEAVSDSLRAYEIPALEATPASAPLAMDGTVMALWTAPDGKSVLASVRHAEGSYEVDRVTALCN